MSLARILGNAVGRVANCPHPWVKRVLIVTFCLFYRIRLKRAKRSEPGAYRNFNDFFTRELATPISPDPKDARTIYAPAEGVISVADNHQSGQLVQAKDQHYSLEELLDHTEAQRFERGSHYVMYLAPHNYHRVHMPQGGQLRRCCYVKGAFFPVNDFAVRRVPRLFCRNERLTCYFDCGGYDMAVIFVAAFLVGGISTVWSEDRCSEQWADSVNARCKTQPQRYHLAAGAELGRFYFGSTVIVLVSRPAQSMLCGTGQAKRVGTALARIS